MRTVLGAEQNSDLNQGSWNPEAAQVRTVGDQVEAGDQGHLGGDRARGDGDTSGDRAGEQQHVEMRWDAKRKDS